MINVIGLGYIGLPTALMLATSMEGEDFRKIDYSAKRVLVIGNEGSGVSRLVKKESDVLVSIPMNQNVESLNASVAASILIYHMGANE